MSKNKAIIVAAPSGSGKTTIVKYLLARIPSLQFSISATSREKRPNERHKADYYFMTEQEFRKRIEQDDFIEWEEVYNGTFYGTLKSEVDRIWSEGKFIIFDVDIQGAISLKRYFGSDGLSLFIRVSDPAVLEKRLRRRGTEDYQSLQERLQKATHEMEFESQFDRVVVNDDLKTAQQEAEEIVRNFLNN